MFYLIEIAKGDASIQGKAVYEYATEDEAVGNFHRKVGNAILSNKFTEETCLVIDSDGAVYESKHHIKPVAEPEVVVEPTEG